MAKIIASVKAIITRLVFGAHGFVAIWQVTNLKRNPIFWYLCCPIVLLFFEGIFTLTIKANQEWKWFCPSVFLYLGSVVPAIWLLELDKVERRLRSVVDLNDTLDLSNVEDLKQLQKALGVEIRLPDIQISRETWVTLIEQFLMLILIVGRWMLPKGDLTRDQLSQLLLVYIGTAADIIEFFDSFKEDRVARERLLVHLTLAIWSWSLMQFTVVLTATKSRKSRLSSASAASGKAGCCSIDVWAIAINMILQDAPFLAFRLILIVHYEIVSYMNIFFTCKNTLVILLQLYRLYVVQSEARARRRKQPPSSRLRRDSGNLSLVSRPDSYGLRRHHGRKLAGQHRRSDLDQLHYSKRSKTRRKRRTRDSDSDSDAASSSSMRENAPSSNRQRHQDDVESGKYRSRTTQTEARRKNVPREPSSEDSQSDDAVSQRRVKHERRRRRSDRD